MILKNERPEIKMARNLLTELIFIFAGCYLPPCTPM